MQDLKIEVHCDKCNSGVSINPRDGSRIASIGGVITWVATCPLPGVVHEVAIPRIDAFDMPGGQSAIDYLLAAGAVDKLGQVAAV